MSTLKDLAKMIEIRIKSDKTYCLCCGTEIDPNNHPGFCSHVQFEWHMRADVFCFTYSTDEFSDQYIDELIGNKLIEIEELSPCLHSGGKNGKYKWANITSYRDNSIDYNKDVLSSARFNDLIIFNFSSTAIGILNTELPPREYREDLDF